MLFYTETGYLNIVSEPQFKNVFTLQANNPNTLKLFESNTPASIMMNRKADLKFVLHVKKEVVAETLDCMAVLFEVEETKGQISASAPIFLVEGYSHADGIRRKLLIKAHEMRHMQTQISELTDSSIYPIYAPLEAIMNNGGLKY